MTLRESGDYPWSGDIRIEIDPETPARFDLKLRIPGWARGARGDGQWRHGRLLAERGYATISRRWSPGDIVTLRLPMPTERLFAHPNVRMDVGRVALRRGPLIYCVEEADNPGGPVQSLVLPRGAALQPKWRDDLFDGVMTLTAKAERLATGDGEGRLYSTAPPAARGATLTALPYHLWANREPGSMEVWVAEAVK